MHDPIKKLEQGNMRLITRFAALIGAGALVISCVAIAGASGAMAQTYPNGQNVSLSTVVPSATSLTLVTTSLSWTLVPGANTFSDGSTSPTFPSTAGLLELYASSNDVSGYSLTEQAANATWTATGGASFPDSTTTYYDQLDRTFSTTPQNIDTITGPSGTCAGAPVVATGAVSGFGYCAPGNTNTTAGNGAGTDTFYDALGVDVNGAQAPGSYTNTLVYAIVPA
jgi:hypothetical protein